MPATTAASFGSDPLRWLARVVAASRSGRHVEMVAAAQPAEWVSPKGHPWRLVRTSDGVEIRPGLVAPFLQFGESPKITALGIGDTVEVELTTRDGRWVGTFPISAFDLVALAKAMLAEQALAHDNLPRLFPPSGE